MVFKVVEKGELFELVGNIFHPVSDMDNSCSKNGEACPQLLDLIPQEKEWHVKRKDERKHGSSEEKKLELKLGPPGEDN